MPIKEKAQPRLERTVRIGQLLEIYGPLLTERQREFTRLHHHEDMSFGEIAREYDVSRQAVHDAVRHAEAVMEQYEQQLGLIGRWAGARRGGQLSPGTGEAISQENLAAVIVEVEQLRQRLATQGIIYDSGQHVRALDGIIERLKGLTGR